jgi:hypothetical protein
MHSSLQDKPMWLLEEELAWWFADGTVRKLRYAPDESLLPIRPEPDENSALPFAKRACIKDGSA